MEQIGKIIHIGTAEQITDNFTKRVVVIQTDGRYPQELPMELSNSNCSKLDGLAINDVVKCSFDLRGRGKDGRWWLSANLFKIEKA